MNVAVLREHLKQDEGVRAKPYKDSLGILSIGVGRNLEHVGLRPSEIDFLLTNDIEEVEKDLQTFSWWQSLNEPRQVALANLRFQLGPNRFRGFKKMLQALSDGNWNVAADEAQDSKWYTQTQKSRTSRVIHMLRHGTYP